MRMDRRYTQMLRKISATVLLCLTFSAAAADTIMVDTRLMLLAHPLFASFDTATGRFKGSSSEFVMGGQEGVDQLIAEIKKLDQWLLNSPKRLQEKLHLVPLPNRISAERAFLAEKRQVEKRLATLQIRAYNARLVPGRPGITPEVSTMPQINEIGSDIRAVLKLLKERYKTNIVIDAAELLPITSHETAKNELLIKNLHRKLWKNQKLAADEDFDRWVEQADSYWAMRFGLNANVIPVGARDVRLEAIKLLEDRTKGIKQ